MCDFEQFSKRLFLRHLYRNINDFETSQEGHVKFHNGPCAPNHINYNGFLNFFWERNHLERVLRADEPDQRGGVGEG